MPDAIGKQITLENKTLVNISTKAGAVLVDDVLLNNTLKVPTFDLVKDGINGYVGVDLHNTYLYEY